MAKVAAWKPGKEYRTAGKFKKEQCPPARPLYGLETPFTYSLRVGHFPGSGHGNIGLLANQVIGIDVAGATDGVILAIGPAGHVHPTAAENVDRQFLDIEGGLEIARTAAVELEGIAFFQDDRIVATGDGNFFKTAEAAGNRGGLGRHSGAEQKEDQAGETKSEEMHDVVDLRGSVYFKPKTGSLGKGCSRTKKRDGSAISPPFPALQKFPASLLVAHHPWTSPVQRWVNKGGVFLDSG